MSCQRCGRSVARLNYKRRHKCSQCGRMLCKRCYSRHPGFGDGAVFLCANAEVNGGVELFPDDCRKTRNGSNS